MVAKCSCSVSSVAFRSRSVPFHLAFLRFATALVESCNLGWPFIVVDCLLLGKYAASSCISKLKSVVILDGAEPFVTTANND